MGWKHPLRVGAQNMVLVQWNDSVGKGLVCHQAWGPEFRSQGPHVVVKDNWLLPVVLWLTHREKVRERERLSPFKNLKTDCWLLMDPTVSIPGNMQSQNQISPNPLQMRVPVAEHQPSLNPPSSWAPSEGWESHNGHSALKLSGAFVLAWSSVVSSGEE